MKKVTAIIFFILALFIPVRSRAQRIPDPQIKHLYDSVALLYTQDLAGDMRMTCSVTAFASAPSLTGKTTAYRFVSASHCVEGNDDNKQKLQKFYISADAKGAKAYFPAKLIVAGDKVIGDDFSLFEVETTEKFEITSLGNSDTLKLGDQVIDVSGALGFGKQYFQGYISENHLDRPPVDAQEVQWTDVMLVQIGGGPGSSGSAIVSVSQNAIVGFLVGSDSGGDIGKICVPVAKFEAFIKAVDAGTYHKTKKADEAEEPNTQQQR